MNGKPAIHKCAATNVSQFQKITSLFQSFTMRGVITIADVWDGTNKDFISNGILLEKLHVHNNWISEWFTIKTVVTYF